MADEYYKVFVVLNAPKSTGKWAYHRAGRLSVPEIMTIMKLCHNSDYRYLLLFPEETINTSGQSL